MLKVKLGEVSKEQLNTLSHSHGHDNHISKKLKKNSIYF